MATPRIFGLIVAFLICAPLAEAGKGYVDFNYYYDTRDLNVLTINTFAKISTKFQYFSLLNLFTASDTNDNFDSSGYLTEQNLRYQIADSPFDLTMQILAQTGEKNDQLRFGSRVRLTAFAGIRKLVGESIEYSVTFHFLQLDSLTGFNWQIEHVYFVPLLTDRIYLSGFFDHNILRNGNKIVTEHQLGLRLVDQFYAVTEFKINEFTTSKKSGWGLGLEYKIIF